MGPPARTPPNKQKSVLQVSSETDMATLDPESPIRCVGRRPKRPRKEDEKKSEELTLKEELMAMLCDWKTGQDAILNKLCSDMAELKEQNASIKATSNELEKSIKFMSSQYEDIRHRLLKMEQERQKNLNYIISLENKIDDMQKKLKFTVIEFRNLPQQLKQETQQDLCELIQKTCKSFNTEVPSSDIRDVYRITTKSGTAVVTDLTSVLSKNRILNGVREFNQNNPNNKLSSLTIGFPGPANPVYISESLTNKDKKLFALAREAAKTLKFKYCWTRRGNIYMKKEDGGSRLTIRDENDLPTIKAK